MKAFKRILILVWFLIPTSFINGQSQLIYNNANAHTFLFKYNNAQNPNQDVNSIIRKISENTGKGVYRTEYFFNYEQSARITKQGNLFTIEISHTNLNCTGDVIYKGFPLSDLLVPSKTSFKTEILSNQNILLKTLSFSDIHFVENAAELAANTYKDSSNTDLKLRVYDQVFIYSPLKINAIHDRILHINEYYAADAIIDISFHKLNALNPANFETIEIQDASLFNIEREIIQLEKSNLNSKLNLTAFDPVQLLKKLHVLKQQALLTRGAMEQQKANLHVSYYNKGLENIINGKPNVAQSFFEKSLNFNPHFSPSLFQLAKINFSNGQMEQSESKLRQILKQHNPDPETRKNTTDLITEIADVYLEEGVYLIANFKFESALLELNKSRLICSEIPGIICSESLYKNIAEAKYGIYKKIISSASDQFTNAKIEASEKLIEEALKYQLQNSFEIPHAEEALDLQKKVKYKKYLLAIDSGKEYLNLKKYKLALNEFNVANQLENQFLFKTNQELENLRKKAAKPVLLDMAEVGLLEVKVNNLHRAKQLSYELTELCINYNLKGDKELGKKLEELKSKIDTQECINAQLKADYLFEDGLKSKISLNYIQAQNLFESALALSSEHRDCQLNTSKCREENLNIIPAATYQKLLLQTKDLVVQSNLSSALEKYKECERYYYQFNIAEFGIVNPQLVNFSIEQNNLLFSAYVAEYFINFNEPDKALILIKSLVQNGYPSSKLKKSLILLGTSLALRDMKQKLSGKPKNYALQYTGGDKRLKHLHKSYIKQWRKK